jgi:hypothetical protein
MKLPNLSSAVLAVMALAATGLATDYADWVAKGYRWSRVSGPYAYIAKQDAKKGVHPGKSESEVARRAYYLRPGKVVLVVETDAAEGLSKIRIGGVASDLWTATRNLSTRPVKNLRGNIESPERAGILPDSSPTPSPGLSAGPPHR